MKEFTYEQKAMGTEIDISLVCEEESVAAAAANSMFARIQEYEAKYSRFRDDSLVSQLNQNGQALVDDEFLNLVETAITKSLDSKGTFNPLLQVSALGYTRPYDDINQQVMPLSRSNYNTNVADITIDRERQQITLAPSQQLDFGGFLKGYLAEKLADEQFKSQQFAGVIVNLGGDLATYGTDEDGQPFEFSIWNPVLEVDLMISLKDSALSTSGTYKRSWQTTQGTRHHLVSPSGQTSTESEAVSVSVAGPSGLNTEILTKQIINTFPQIDPPLPLLYSYLVITKDGNTHGTLITN